VRAYYARWFKEFPTWNALAQATNAHVIRAWSGLGYNRCALVLRDIARVVMRDGIPQSTEAWLSLKGIGHYTAVAVSAFAQKKRVLPIDTNIRRVLGRFCLGKPFPSLQDDKRIHKHIDAFLPRRGAYWDVPQALFDLAWMICTKTPSCAVCPLQKNCKASKKFLSGSVKIPRRSIRVSIEYRHRDKPYPDRIYRGRILKILREKGQVGIWELGLQIDQTFNKKHDTYWLMAMIKRLEKDHLLKQNQKTVGMPE
jgi:A/G-specific adenine glycosylase